MRGRGGYAAGAVGIGGIELRRGGSETKSGRAVRGGCGIVCGGGVLVAKTAGCARVAALTEISGDEIRARAATEEISGAVRKTADEGQRLQAREENRVERTKRRRTERCGSLAEDAIAAPEAEPVQTKTGGGVGRN